MRKIAVMNQKGGCGKTTISINLAAAFATLDKRVLLVDMDPQSHASVGLGVRESDVELTSYELLMDPAIVVEDARRQVSEHLDLVSSSTVLSGVEQELAEQMGREERLKNKIDPLGENAYDYLIIDCPPSVGLLTFNALIATDEVLIPVDASYFSLHGLAKLRETVEVIEEELQRKFKVHVVCNNLDTRTHFSNDLLAEVERFHEAVLADVFISHTVRLKEAAARGQTIFDIASRSKAARQFASLARELDEKAPRVQTEALDEWMEKVNGPRRTHEGVVFTLDVPNAESVAVTGEFTNWSREGVPLHKDSDDGLWKTVLDIKSGEYEYRFIVDGVWIRDPANRDYIRNEFGQENSLLIV
jgi:chromosome partitioning protein